MAFTTVLITRLLGFTHEQTCAYCWYVDFVIVVCSGCFEGCCLSLTASVMESFMTWFAIVA